MNWGVLWFCLSSGGWVTVLGLRLVLTPSFAGALLLGSWGGVALFAALTLAGLVCAVVIPRRVQLAPAQVELAPDVAS